MAFSRAERQEWIDALRHEPVDVVVVGGGVVGCSIAAHLAALDLPCALVERDDLAAGASGNSTGLAHAGLRYLAQGRFFYVFHESRERHRLQRLAPQWTKPFDFVFPVFDGDPFGLAMVRLGTTIYDAMGWFDAVLTGTPRPRSHAVLSPQMLAGRIPGLRLQGLRGATEYFVDAQLNDSRFTLGLAQAAAARGAKVLTKMRMTTIFEAAPGAVVRVEDALTGQTIDIRTRLVINATGAWIDETQAGGADVPPVVQPSQGIHLVVDRVAEVPLIFSAPQKGRVFFVLPFGSDASLVGTTDRPIDGAVDQSKPSAEEVDDLLSMLLGFFPGLGPKDAYAQAHVRGLYWAARPLLRQTGSTLAASREHQLVRHRPYLWSVPGVKLTAGRAVGEEVARKVDLALHARRHQAIDLGILPGGSPGTAADWNAQSLATLQGLEGAEASAAWLVERYGSRAADVASLVRQEISLGRRVFAGEPWLLAEVAYAAREEMVLDLNDLLWRRTKWAHYRAIPPDAAATIAGVLGGELGWSQERMAESVEAFAREQRRHRLPLNEEESGCPR